MTLSIQKIRDLIQQKRNDEISKIDDMRLALYYKGIMTPIFRMVRKSDMYEENELFSYYWEGIYNAFVGKKKNGEYYVDLDHPNFMTKIYCMGYNRAKEFFRDLSRTYLLKFCSDCGKTSSYKKKVCKCGCELSKTDRRNKQIVEMHKENDEIKQVEKKLDVSMMIDYISRVVGKFEYIFDYLKKNYLCEKIRSISTFYSIGYNKVQKDIKKIREIVSGLGLTIESI